MGAMQETPETDAQSDLAAVIDTACSTHEPVYLRRGGRRVAAIIAAEDLKALIDAAEDLSDQRAVAASRAEMVRTGEKPIPWAQIRAELDQP